MEKLREIIEVIGRRRIKRIEVLNDGKGWNDPKNNYYRLYSGIRDGKYGDDEEAAQHLFGVNARNKRYRMLKSRLRKKLLNTMIFVDNPFSKLGQIRIDCYRSNFVGQFLVRRSAHTAGQAMLRKALKQALKHQFTEVAVQSARMLREEMAFEGRQGEYRKYDQLLSEQFELLSAEMRAEKLYEDIMIQVVRSSVVTTAFKEQLRKSIAEIEQLLEAHPSHHMRMFRYRLLLQYYPTHRMFDELLETCNEVQEYVSSNPDLARQPDFHEFIIHRIIAYLHLGDFENGWACVQRDRNFFRAGSGNWAIMQEVCLLIAIHSGRFTEAAEIYEEMVSSRRFQMLDTLRSEKWKIFGAYLRYVIDPKDLDIESLLGKYFNLGKFLNEVPEFSKDKRGMNIAILVIQILFLLFRKDYNSIIGRTEALKVYSSRYLKTGEYKRVNFFLRMIYALERNDFDVANAEVEVAPLLKQLRETPYMYEDGSRFDLEIIPYDELWKVLVNQLKQK